MDLLQINLGTPPSGNDGDTLRTAFVKTSENFEEINTYINEVLQPIIQRVQLLDLIEFPPTMSVLVSSDASDHIFDVTVTNQIRNDYEAFRLTLAIKKGEDYLNPSDVQEIILASDLLLFDTDNDYWYAYGTQGVRYNANTVEEINIRATKIITSDVYTVETTLIGLTTGRLYASDSEEFTVEGE